MKAMILAGGAGRRLAEETATCPKPMVEIGGKPILWHVMKSYAYHGITDFIVCLGHQGDAIRRYFATYSLHHADVTLDLANDRTTLHARRAEPWRVTLVDTGEETMTGGRVKRAAPYLDGDDDFCLTYADGVGDVDVGRLVRFHRACRALATVTVVRPPERFGLVSIAGDRVTRFEEKPQRDEWVNAGYFVVSRRVVDTIGGDETIWEREPLERLAREGQLAAYRHEGCWHCMDTPQDRQRLQALWDDGRAPWKVW